MRFRSDLLRELVREAVAQGFDLSAQGKRHPRLVCPACRKMVIVSLTGKQAPREHLNSVARLRDHGLVWRGRPAAQPTHTKR